MKEIKITKEYNAQEEVHPDALLYLKQAYKKWDELPISQKRQLELTFIAGMDYMMTKLHALAHIMSDNECNRQIEQEAKAIMVRAYVLKKELSQPCTDPTCPCKLKGGSHDILAN
jgi:hypothetical protein